MRRLSFLLLLLTIAACGDTNSGPVADPDVATPDASVDALGDASGVSTDALEVSTVDPDAAPPGDAVESDTPPDTIDASPDATPQSFDPYDISFVHEVELNLEPESWASLRAESRSIFGILGPGCLTGPPPQVFNWYRADLRFDGRPLAAIGLRKKGFLGSLDGIRPALRIETDHFIADQELEGYEHFTLNNGRQDPSRLRQCLAYDVFRKAGIPAPRCSFAHVTVNGDDLGLYILVEPVRKAFIRDHFSEGPEDAATRQLWEGTLSDFRVEFMSTFEPKFDSAPVSTAPIEAVMAALEAPDDDLVRALSEVIDLDAFMTFWAVEVVLAHWDGYAGNTNNFFIYQAADGRLRFLPWGVDGTFVDLPDRPDGTPAPVSVLALGALVRRLYLHPDGQARYHAALRKVLADVWDPGAMLAKVDAWETLTAPHREVGLDEVALTSLDQLRVFIATRRSRILAELESPPAWNEPLRGPICLKDAGIVKGSFETTWGTLGLENIFLAGTGTLVVSSELLPPLAFDAVGSKAGVDAVGMPGVPQLVVGAHVVGAGFVVIIFQLPAGLAPGPVEVDHVDTYGYAYYFEDGAEPQLIGLLAEGAVAFEAISEVDKAPVSGSFELSLFLW